MITAVMLMDLGHVWENMLTEPNWWLVINHDWTTKPLMWSTLGAAASFSHQISCYLFMNTNFCVESSGYNLILTYPSYVRYLVCPKEVIWMLSSFCFVGLRLGVVYRGMTTTNKGNKALKVSHLHITEEIGQFITQFITHHWRDRPVYYTSLKR